MAVVDEAGSRVDAGLQRRHVGRAEQHREQKGRAARPPR